MVTLDIFTVEISAKLTNICTRFTTKMLFLRVWGLDNNILLALWLIFTLISQPNVPISTQNKTAKNRLTNTGDESMVSNCISQVLTSLAKDKFLCNHQHVDKDEWDPHDCSDRSNDVQNLLFNSRSLSKPLVVSLRRPSNLNYKK